MSSYKRNIQITLLTTIAVIIIFLSYMYFAEITLIYNINGRLVILFLLLVLLMLFQKYGDSTQRASKQEYLL